MLLTVIIALAYYCPCPFTCRIEALQLSDMGSYSCIVMAGGRKMVSQAGYIQLEGECSHGCLCNPWLPYFHCCYFIIGKKKNLSFVIGLLDYISVLVVTMYQKRSHFPDLPHFSVEPRDMVVTANSPLSLHCEAHGPPEPVWVIWLQDGVPLTRVQDPNSQSPSTLNMTGSDMLIPCRCLYLSLYDNVAMRNAFIWRDI